MDNLRISTLISMNLIFMEINNNRAGITTRLKKLVYWIISFRRNKWYMFCISCKLCFFCTPIRPEARKKGLLLKNNHNYKLCAFLVDSFTKNIKQSEMCFDCLDFLENRPVTVSSPLIKVNDRSIVFCVFFLNKFAYYQTYFFCFG